MERVNDVGLRIEGLFYLFLKEVVPFIVGLLGIISMVFLSFADGCFASIGFIMAISFLIIAGGLTALYYKFVDS